MPNNVRDLGTPRGRLRTDPSLSFFSCHPQSSPVHGSRIGMTHEPSSHSIPNSLHAIADRPLRSSGSAGGGVKNTRSLSVNLRAVGCGGSENVSKALARWVLTHAWALLRSSPRTCSTSREKPPPKPHEKQLCCPVRMFTDHEGCRSWCAGQCPLASSPYIWY